MRLRQAYRELLARWSWGQFTTNTFRENVHPETAEKIWRVWIAKMNRHFYGHRWERRGEGLYWCRATERQQRGTAHFHGLIGGHGALELDARRWQQEWHTLAGIARMEIPRSQAAVQHYVTKYLARGAELDFGGPLPPGAPPGFTI